MRRADALRDELEQDIVTGVLRPGERLDEQSLAARFGVSRTPIREALMQLASAGLIELQPRRGAFVASLSLREVIERFEVMAALEGACGALAARRITDEERRALAGRRTRPACSEAAERRRRRLLLCQRALPPRHLRGLPQRYLAEQARQLHDRLKPYRRLQLRARSRVAASLTEHQAIVDAILAGDGARAEQLLRDHILIQGERLTDFIASFDTAAVA